MPENTTRKVTVQQCMVCGKVETPVSGQCSACNELSDLHCFEADEEVTLDEE